MSKAAPADHPIHELIAERWSPVVFADRPIEAATLRSLLEAARWAPSSFNEQPWRYVVGAKGDEGTWDGLLDCLVPANQAWAKDAPVLLLSVAGKAFRRNDKPNRHAWHDVGAATACLTLQATAMGLCAHQMAGFLPDKARERFAIPDTHEPVAAAAIGYHGDLAEADEALRERDGAPRSRRTVDEFVIGNGWGEKPGCLA